MINGCSSKLIKLGPKFKFDFGFWKMNDDFEGVLKSLSGVTCCDCNLLCHSFPPSRKGRKQSIFFSNSNYRSVQQWYAQSWGNKREQDEVSISTQKPTPITQQTLVINHIARVDMKTLLFTFLDTVCLRASFILFSIKIQRMWFYVGISWSFNVTEKYVLFKRIFFSIFSVFVTTNLYFFHDSRAIG